MEFRILGGLEAHDGERRLALGGVLQRKLLATLLLNAGRSVSVDDLIDALWDEHAPATAPHAIEVYVSRLRKVLVDGRLVRSGQGYLLDVEGDDVDAVRFEQLVERGRAEHRAGSHQGAAELLRAALALWRGEPLADLDFGPDVRAAVGRLQRLRLDALETRIDADLACGREAGLVTELEDLVEAEPLRERFRGQLMLALYREGRQADALRVYGDTRRTLRDELGLEPSRALQQLERDILNHASELDHSPPPAQVPTRLPAPITPIIGRARELEELDELLRCVGVRMITITGTVGVGKTRLALEAARSVEDEYRDGAVFVDLAPTRRADLVVHAIAEALGIREHSGATLLETLAAALSGRRTLLVLDNFEHVLDAAPVVTELLAASDQLKVVATSRRRLRVYGEHEFVVSPLPTPPAGERSVDALVRFDAVELFAGCTRRRVAGFTIDRENASAVAEICIRLEGIPLAIELAAARSDAFTPQALLEQLDARLPVLVGGPCDAPVRHQSLRATIDWSYNLLDLRERMLFARLSVFTGGFTGEACVEACEAQPSTVESLVEKNLIVRERGRFSMLESLREYALERLRDSGELEEIELRHATFFASLAERAEPELRGPDQLAWLGTLDAEQANIWSAFCRGLRMNRPDLSLRIGAALWRYWEARGTITEARRRLDDALAATGGDAPGRAAALFASGRMALRQGALDHARDVFIEARTLFEADGRRDGVALCAAGLGWITHVVGPYEEAVSLCTDAVELARAGAEDWILADALNNLGVASRAAHDLESSQAALEESLEIRRRIGDLEGVTAGLNGLALNALAEDDFDRAEVLFREAFAVSERRGDLFYEAAKRIVFAYVAFGRRDYGRATVLSVLALDACRENGYRQFSAYALETLAGVAAAEGRLRQAARMLGAAVAISERIGRHGPGSNGVVYDWEARAVKQVLERARQKLGLREWDAAVQDGQRLEPDEALASAVEWTVPPTSESALGLVGVTD
jgi:predicted ATPase/DNA-binding SARP family transcriptional activator